jgi:hypothetical protein
MRRIPRRPVPVLRDPNFYQRRRRRPAPELPLSGPRFGAPRRAVLPSSSSAARCSLRRRLGDGGERPGQFRKKRHSSGLIWSEKRKVAESIFIIANERNPILRMAELQISP